VVESPRGPAAGGAAQLADAPVRPAAGPAEYAAGLQCERHLWLLGRRAMADPRTSAAPSLGGAEGGLAATLRARTELQGLLQALAPTALEVPLDAAPGVALERTRSLLADPAVRALRGAAFQRAGWSARADLLERSRDGRFRLCVLAADTAPREIDFDRAALLAFLVEAAALELAAVEIWFLDREYRRAASGIDWPALVRRRDVSADVRLLCGDVPAALARMAAVWERADCPEVEPSPHCWQPVRCEFWAQCTRSLPAGALVQLPRLRLEQFHALRALGVQRIAEIPDGTPLEPIQARTRAAWRRGGAVVGVGLAERLRAIGSSVAYLDFEAAMPRIPRLPGSAPLEAVPVQWSLLICDAQESRRADFLADPGSDPRAAFAESLVATLVGWQGPIAVYSDFESQVLARLEAQFPGLGPDLARIRGRLVDFLELLRQELAHPEFLGSYSLKRVAPVLAPKIGYADLRGIRDGADAARHLEAWIAGAAGWDEAALRADLAAYCRRDVEALRALHEALCEWAAQSRSA
jgi:hypothetical protein